MGDGSLSIRHKDILTLTTEMFKNDQRFSPDKRSATFMKKPENHCNLYLFLMIFSNTLHQSCQWQLKVALSST